MSSIAGVTCETGRCDDSTASIQLMFADGNTTDDGVAASWEGAVRGPVCQFSRTLAADFPVSRQGNVSITEPCYWTPTMPFLYDVAATLATPGGISRSVERALGLRRLESRGRSLFLEGKRIVLRGTTVSPARDVPTSPDAENLLTAARDEGAALLIRGYDVAFCFSAAEKGIPVVVDLRDDPRATTMRLPSPAEQPAVVAWIIAESQAENLDRLPGGTLLAVAGGGAAEPSSIGGTSLLAVELHATSPPPAWLANAVRPVIAIRPSSGPSRIEGARQRASAWQAALAPTFDFAGYFA